MAWYVNGEILDDNAVREEARSMRPRYEEATTAMDPIEAEMQLREWARENVIERMLLRQTAASDPEPVPAEVIEKGLESVRTEAGGQVGCGTRTGDEEIRGQLEIEYRVQRLIGRLQEEIPRPSEKEIAAYYKKHRDQFRTPEMIRARHIVKNVDEHHDEESARAAIEQAESELRNGTSFEEIADSHSDCAGNGGDLGWFPRGEMVDEFEKAVFALPVGKVSTIFRSPFGFHLARLEGRKPEGVRPLAEVKEEIVATLLGEKQNKALEDYLDQLRAKAEIRQVKAAQ